VSALPAASPVPSIEVAEARIAVTLADPAVRHWVKDALRSACDRDPVDAAQDAEMVARLLGDRVDAMLVHLSDGAADASPLSGA
jgi:hypothetical protein